MATAKELFEGVVIPAARENAFATEGLRSLADAEGVRIDETLEFARTVYAGAQMVIDSMSSPREFHDYVQKPISDRTYRALTRMLVSEFAWMSK